MAFRAVTRRCPVASSQVRQMLQNGRQQRRAYAEEYTGKGFSEKEKGAENRFIHEREVEHAAKRAASEHGATASSGSSTASTVVSEAASKTGLSNIAVVAGIVAVVAGVWLWSSSGKKEEKKDEESS